MMNATEPAGPAPGTAPAEPDPSLVRLTHVIYGLYAASFFAGVTAIAAIIIDYVKRDDAQGTWLESHFRWQIRTFWLALLWGVVGAILALAVVGFAVLAVVAIWFIYRIAKGWVALYDRKPVGLPVRPAG